MEAAVVTAAEMGAAEGAGVRGHPGETGNAVAATDHDHGAEIDPVEVGDVPDPGNFVIFLTAIFSVTSVVEFCLRESTGASF